jgi:hypothetical protein
MAAGITKIDFSRLSGFFGSFFFTKLAPYLTLVPKKKMKKY